MVEELLNIAVDLAQRDSGRPKQTSLRRSVSTAYYALFHALAEFCADTMATYSGSDWDAYTLVYRSLDHNGAKKTFDRNRDGKLLGPDIAELGLIFVQLQSARIKADNVPSPFPFGRSEVLEFIEQARRATATVGTLRKTRRGRLLAAHLVTKPR
jgi:hypothetical protein